MSSPGVQATEPTHFCLIYQFQIATNSVVFFFSSLHLVATTVKQRDIDINNNANENKN